MSLIASKTRTLSIAACFTLAAIMLGGCASNKSASSLSAIEANPAQPVSIEKAGQGSFSRLRHIMVKRVTSAQQLNALGLNPGAKGFNVDFSKNDVVIIALGKRNQSGYWTKITALQREGNTLYVQGIANKPSDNQAATSKVTYPFALAIVPKDKAAHLVSDIKSVEGQQEK